MGGCASRPKWLVTHKGHNESPEPQEDQKSPEPIGATQPEKTGKATWHTDETKRRSLGVLFSQDDEVISEKADDREQTESVAAQPTNARELKLEPSNVEAVKKVEQDGEVISKKDDDGKQTEAVVAQPTETGELKPEPSNVEAEKKVEEVMAPSPEDRIGTMQESAEDMAAVPKSVIDEEHKEAKFVKTDEVTKVESNEKKIEVVESGETK